MTLACNNLTLAYCSKKNHSPTPVLTAVDLAIERGQVLVLQGPNGSGKSTLMKAMARQLRPQAGTVTLDGRDIWQMDVQTFAQKVAYVPQTLTAPQFMTVHELVALGRSPHQKLFQLSLTDNDRSLITAAMSRCGVDDLQDKLVSQLSGGERQRTVIAMALTQGPDYLLLDEPTASLDFRYQLELIDLLGQLKDDGLGIGLILHDLNIAAQLADKIALIAAEENSNNGGSKVSRIVAQGTVEAVLEREILQRVFAVDIEILKGVGKDVYLPTRLK